MAYKRPRPEAKLSKDERAELLTRYYGEYRAWATEDASQLNRKVPREVFEGLLNQIGELLLEHAAQAATSPGPVRQFLDDNPLPPSLTGKLPDEFRAFALVMNALKQWVSDEQAATDEYLLGAKVREECKAGADVCIVTGAPLAGDEVELHHPVRDGRPPLPLSKEGHKKLEGQGPAGDGEGLPPELRKLKKKGGGRSWARLKRGCLELLGEPVSHSGNARTAALRFAREAAKETGLSHRELLSLLEGARLGLGKE